MSDDDDNMDDDDELVMLAVANIAAAIVMELEEDDPVVQLEWTHLQIDINVWRTMVDLTFQKHFRMSRVLFQSLLDLLSVHLRETGVLQRERTPLNVCLMAVLWILASNDTFRSVALKFNFDPGITLYTISSQITGIYQQGTLHFHYRYIIRAFRELSARFISWPSREERAVIKRTFEERTGYPGVVGAIDGMHSYVIAPGGDARSYTNRHHTYSILTQAVGDCNMVLRDLYVGEPGGTHDSRAFRRSPLGRNLFTNRDLLEQDEHLLGDGAYTLTDKVITPFRDPDRNDVLRCHHNVCHSSCRSIVERIFGGTKVKWRRLKHFHVYVMEYAVDHIISCFFLHNFILLEGVPYNDLVVPNEEVPDDANVGLNGIHPDDPIMRAARAAGEIKRMRIATHLLGLMQ